MQRILSSRRSVIALSAMTLLSAVALIKGIDTSSQIAAVAIAVSASNAYQRKNPPQ